MIKLELIKYDNANCLEATWLEVTEEVKQTPKLDEEGKEIEGEFVEETTTKQEQIKCVAYSDLQIDMLRADALEMNTTLDEYEDLISEVEANIVLPTQEELDQIELVNKIAEAKAYLVATDYKVLPDYDKPNEEIIAKRAEAREFIRANS